MTLKQESFKTWIKNNLWMVILSTLVALVGWQQSEMQSMMREMIRDINARCNDVEQQLLNLEAKQVYDRVEIEAIKREIEWQREVIEHIRSSRERGSAKPATLSEPDPMNRAYEAITKNNK